MARKAKPGVRLEVGEAFAFAIEYKLLSAVTSEDVTIGFSGFGNINAA
jgi:hypothetical protein